MNNEARDTAAEKDARDMALRDAYVLYGSSAGAYSFMWDRSAEFHKNAAKADGWLITELQNLKFDENFSGHWKLGYTKAITDVIEILEAFNEK